VEDVLVDLVVGGNVRAPVPLCLATASCVVRSRCLCISAFIVASASTWD
jgi:hypothetical protein